MKKTTRARTLSAEAIASAQTTDHGVLRIALDDELARAGGGLPPVGGRLCGGTNTCLALLPIES